MIPSPRTSRQRAPMATLRLFPPGRVMSASPRFALPAPLSAIAGIGVFAGLA